MLRNGYIKLHRAMMDWCWYDDIYTTRLFIHLLLTVSIKDSKWHNETIKRGSRVTSYKTLAFETHLTEQQVRTAVKHLESTGELTRHKMPNYTVFTIQNYSKYQDVTRELTGHQQGNNKASTEHPQGTHKAATGHQQQYKKNKEDIKEDIKKNKEESPVRQEPPGLLAARGLHINEGGDF